MAASQIVVLVTGKKTIGVSPVRIMTAMPICTRVNSSSNHVNAGSKTSVNKKGETQAKSSMITKPKGKPRKKWRREDMCRGLDVEVSSSVSDSLSSSPECDTPTGDSSSILKIEQNFNLEIC
mmetsp:Transcript_25878/g.31395  ORF Transcript_25878/g.31395 Transcript_25878/m.31395 type:complete len:122 (-) Transcript_25878:13-378(-)